MHMYMSKKNYRTLNGDDRNDVQEKYQNFLWEALLKNNSEQLMQNLLFFEVILNTWRIYFMTFCCKTEKCLFG